MVVGPRCVPGRVEEPCDRLGSLEPGTLLRPRTVRERGEQHVLGPLVEAAQQRRVLLGGTESYRGIFGIPEDEPR
jgi:hypothetical protein